MKGAVCCVALALICLAAQAQTGTSAAAAGQFTIAGKVVNAVTGEPVRRATVAALTVEDSHAIASQESDSDGNFELTGLAAAKYQLTASKRGMRTAFYEEHDLYSSAIVTGRNQDTTHLIFRLTPGSVLHGVVTGDGGDPVAEANVMLFLKPHGHNPGDRIVETDSTTTDDTGAYEFGNLAAGEYLVAVKTEPWYALHRPLNRARQDGGGALDVAYPVTFYDSTTEEGSATSIVLAGGNREEANINLHAVPALHLTVELPHRANDTVAQPELRQAIFGTQMTQDSTGTATPGQPGTIEFIGVAPGQYELEQGDPPRVAELDATDSEQVDPELGVPIVNLSGRVRTDSGAALMGEAFVSISRIDGAYGGAPMNASTSNGTFKFSLPAQSEWEATATPNGGSGDKALAVVATTVGSRITAGNKFTVKDQPVSIVLTVSEATQRVEGFVRKNGKGFAGAMIVLVPRSAAGTPKSSMPGRAFPELARRDQSDSDGSFSLRDVAPGPYIVVAIEDAWEIDWARPEVISRYLSGGIAVTVSGSSGKIVEVSQPVPVQRR